MVPGRRWTDGMEKWRGWAPTIGSVLAVVSPWRAGGTPWHLQASGGGTALGRAGPGEGGGSSVTCRPLAGQVAHLTWT